jgi:two-component system, OmpR family, response regulator
VRKEPISLLRLRGKIENDPARPQFIKTERGTGYVFSVDVHIVR